MQHIYTILKLSLCMLFFTTCSEGRNFFEEQPLGETKATHLTRLTLEQAININYWLAAGKSATGNPLHVPLPYRQTGNFIPGASEAVALKFKAKQGQKVQIHVKSRTQGVKVFAHVLELSNRNYIPHKTFCEPSNAVTFEFDALQTGNYLLRLQPELMKTGSYEVEIHTAPSLVFPVMGKSCKAIGSFWGAPRDNGKRWHKGVDIFAPKGTPVVAVADGYVYRSGINLLGGNFVRLYDSLHNRTFYYAHLDTNLVQENTYVKAGDILGTIGNTGNAHNTPPHLHFGIYYNGDGAVDPLCFIQKEESAPPIIANSALAGEFVQIEAERLNVRSAPGTSTGYLTTLHQNEVCRVLAITDNWLLIELPGKKIGFISADYVQPIKPQTDQIAESGLNQYLKMASLEKEHTASSYIPSKLKQN